MRLERVTITGVDDNVEMSVIDELTDRFDLLEWGILLSNTRKGSARYPNDRWLAELTSTFYDKYTDRFSAHLCGSLCDTIITDIGESYLNGELVEYSRPAFFCRIQLNGYPDKIWEQSQINALASALSAGTEITELILPIPNEDVLTRVRYNTFLPNINFLHDQSRGRGITPTTWPEARLPGFVGFAGGINPDNVREVLDTLYARGTSDQWFWIDMETGVRTDDQLDPAKVEKVMTIAGGYL